MPRIKAFPGLNIEDDPFEVGLEGLVTAQNVDITSRNKLSRRAGYTETLLGTITAAWGDGDIFLFIEGGNLKSYNADGTTSTLRTGLTVVDKLTGERAYDDRVYWTTGQDSGVVQFGVDRAIGVLQPSSFQVTEIDGALPSGLYLLALAYVAHGEEGPLSWHSFIDASGGVSVEIPNTVAELLAADVSAIRLYISTTNGQQLYFAGEQAVGESNYITYTGDATGLSIPADASHAHNMPADGIFASHGGRLWGVAHSDDHGDSVVYSHPYSELTDLRKNFIQFDAAVTMMGSVSGGLYVGTEDEVVFLTGDDPEQMTHSTKLNYGVIPGTMVKVDGRVIGEGVPAEVLLWASERGLCAGFPDGEVRNLTERRVGTLTGHAGAAILRRANGQNHYLAVLRS